MSQLVKAEDLTQIKNDDLAMILGAGNKIFESEPMSTLPVLIRAYTSPAYIGECWGKIESCPDVRLFITVTTGELYDVPQLYELPKEKGWKYVSHSAPNKGKVQLVFVTTLPGANIDQKARNAWMAKKYTITVGNTSKYEVSPMLNKARNPTP